MMISFLSIKNKIQIIFIFFGEKITPTNIIIITSELIQIVEKYNNLTGMQKKMLVINTIKKIVNEQVNTTEEKLALIIIVDNTEKTQKFINFCVFTLRIIHI